MRGLGWVFAKAGAVRVILVEFGTLKGMRKFYAAGMVVGLSMVGSSAFAYSAYSTGFLSPMGGGSHWTVSGPSVSGPQNAIVLDDGTGSLPGYGFAPNDDGSQWVSFTADGGYSLPSTQTHGIYTYSTTVDFTGSTGILSGHLWADDSLLGISVDSIDLGLSPITSPQHGMNSGFWRLRGADFELAGYTGIHTLSFSVKNGVDDFSPTHDPTGFRTHISLQSTPEPFTMSLGIASVGLFVRRRLKANRG